MSLLHIAILALVQGITEFLPVSSSGHLLLTHAFFESGTANAWGADLILDLAVHAGSLAAVLIYFRKDVLKMFAGAPKFLTGNFSDPAARLDLLLIVASIPALAVGFTLHILQPSFLRSVQIVAWCTLIYGILLWVVDKRSPVRRDIRDMNLKDAILIGLAQALALIPGTSRSGITMTASRALGFSRPEAAHFSFLLSIIATGAAVAIGVLELVHMDSVVMTTEAAWAAGFSFIASLATITVLMKLLRTWTFAPFALYRIGLGLALLAALYSGNMAASSSFVSP